MEYVNLTSEEVRDAYSELQKNAAKIAMNEAYFEGKNPYILNKKVGDKPDNRIPVPLAKMAVEKICGYAGRKGDITSEYSKIGETDDADSNKFLNYVRAMDIYNDVELENSELYEEGNIQGESYEVWWVSDHMKLGPGLMTSEYKMVPTSSVYLKYTNDIKRALEYAIHFSGDKELLTATVYGIGFQTKYVSIDGESFSMAEDGLKETPFSQVPINIFPTNRRSNPLFEAEKHLIDQIDELMSKSSNEVDRFNAAIALFGKDIDKQFIDDFASGIIRAMGNLDDMENTSLPRYMTKDLGGIDNFYNTLMDRTLDFYNESIGMLNFSKNDFGSGIQSGLALLIKMYGMEIKASNIETYFNRGLVNRLNLYVDIYNASTKKVDIADYQVKVKSNRNLPVDDESRLRIAAMLQGLGVDLKNVLKFLPNSVIENRTDIEIKEMTGGMGIGDEGGVDLDDIADSGVEAISLNGAQITASQKIAVDVANGLIPRESGIQLVMALGIPREQAEAIVPMKSETKEEL